MTDTTQDELKKHTPLPWKIYEGQPSGHIFRKHKTITHDYGNGSEVAIAHTDYFTTEIAIANAALIVHSVNNYPALEKEVERLREALGEIAAHPGPNADDAAWHRVEVAKAALKARLP